MLEEGKKVISVLIVYGVTLLGVGAFLVGLIVENLEVSQEGVIDHFSLMIGAFLMLDLFVFSLLVDQIFLAYKFYFGD